MAGNDLKGTQRKETGHVKILCWNVTSLNAASDFHLKVKCVSQ